MVLDPKQIEGMASVGATDEEIAGFLGCSGQTIRARFSDVLTKARSNMRLRLRQRQIRAALDGNVVMLIWLGKQMLGQTERQELTGADGAPLVPPAQIQVVLVQPSEPSQAERRAAAIAGRQ